MSSINLFGSNLIKAYISFQANPNGMDADEIKKMEEEMGMDDIPDSTPKQKVEKYILEQAADVSEDVKRMLREMKEQQKKLTELGQAAEGQKLRDEFDQKMELRAGLAQSESDFIDNLTKDDLTTVLNGVLSDTSENADEANVDIVAELTNMIAAKSVTTTVSAEA